MNLSFLKKKSTLVAIAIVVLIGGGIFLKSRANDGPFYETQAVERGLLKQTVDVTGEAKPQTRVDLSFKTGGKLENLLVTVGQTVKMGDVLATLDAQDANFALRRAAASLAQAQANLAARQAQDSPQAIQIAEAQRDQARASLEKAQSDLIQIRSNSAEQVRQAQIALDTAQQNLANSGQGVDLGVQTSLTSLRASIVSATAVLSSALTEADAILGVENTGANDLYESVLSIYDRNALTRAQGLFLSARVAQRQADGSARVLGSSPSAADLIASGQLTVDALQQAQALLDETQKVLTNSGTNTALSTADLATKRSAIQTLRASTATQYTSLSAAVQALRTSENTRTTTRAQLENALRTAQSNLTIAVSNERSQVKSAETAIEVQRAALSSAEATLSQRRSPARAVDLQVLRAQVQDVQVAYEEAAQRVRDTELRAPVAGVISEIIPARGEQLAPNGKVMGLVVTENYTVEASVPEADIAKVSVGQTAVVTLDAFGDDVPFSAKVLSIEPDRIKIQDAIFYKVSVAIDPTERPIKPGMTANITITTGEAADALIIPLRGIRTENGVRRVRVLQADGTAKEVEITLGLRGDEGRVQALTGVNAGDQIIVAELTADAYAKLQAENAKK